MDNAWKHSIVATEAALADILQRLITQLQSPLPAGENKIGKVDVDTLPDKIIAALNDISINISNYEGLLGNIQEYTREISDSSLTIKSLLNSNIYNYIIKIYGAIRDSTNNTLPILDCYNKTTFTNDIISISPDYFFSGIKFQMTANKI